MTSVPDATTLPMRGAPDAARERGHDLGRKAVGKGRERLLEDDAGHLPVTGHRVLARGGLGHAAPGAGRHAAGMAERGHETVEPEVTQRGQVQGDAAGDVAERVAALVTVPGRVGQFADADAVEHDRDDPLEADTHAGDLRPRAWPRRSSWGRSDWIGSSRWRA